RLGAFTLFGELGLNVPFRDADRFQLLEAVCLRALAPQLPGVAAAGEWSRPETQGRLWLAAHRRSPPSAGVHPARVISPWPFFFPIRASDSSRPSKTAM